MNTLMAILTIIISASTTDTAATQVSVSPSKPSTDAPTTAKINSEFRIIPHLARQSGGFSSTIVVANPGARGGDVTLSLFDDAGRLVTSLTQTVAPGLVRYATPQDLFGADIGGYVVITGAPSIVVSTTYESLAEDSSPAHVHEQHQTSQRWRIYPGNWDHVWDGLAMVNTGHDATSITAELWFKTGDLLTSESLGDLASGAKKLVVLADILPDVFEGHIDITADQPLALTALRGSYAGADTAYLWENQALPLTDDIQSSDLAYDFAAHAPWYLCPEQDWPPDTVTVTAFDRQDHYFGEVNMREVAQEVAFPEAADWHQVGLMVNLECPESGLCDHWDRTGTVQLVLNPDADPSQWEHLEIGRYITPYRMGMCQFIDVTPLAGFFVGRQTLVSAIDTWVGPGHSDGDGWRVTIQFVFFSGNSAERPEVVNIWGRRSIVLGYLDEERNVDSQIEPVPFYVPGDAKKVEAHLITTGHSFGNSLNCAEFCTLRQDVWINENRHSVIPWRDDCEYNPVSPQAGTWRFDRNGWCPGAVVTGFKVDVTPSIDLGSANTVDFDIRLPSGDQYDNQNPADYDPSEWVSLKLYIYR